MNGFTWLKPGLYNPNELDSYRSLTSFEIQAEWSKVEAAQQRYYAAAEQYNRVLQECQELLLASAASTVAVRQAGDQQTSALREYMSLLQAFSRLAAREPFQTTRE